MQFKIATAGQSMTCSRECIFLPRGCILLPCSQGCIFLSKGCLFLSNCSQGVFFFPIVLQETKKQKTTQKWNDETLIGGKTRSHGSWSNSVHHHTVYPSVQHTVYSLHFLWRGSCACALKLQFGFQEKSQSTNHRPLCTRQSNWKKLIQHEEFTAQCNDKAEFTTHRIAKCKRPQS